MSNPLVPISDEIGRLVPIENSAPVPAVPAHPTDASRRFASQSASANTRRAYQMQFASWLGYAARVGTAPVPADPVHVANWLSERAEQGAGRASIRIGVAAIKGAHVEAGTTFNAAHPGFASVIKGLMRSEATARVTRQAAPLKADLLRQVLEANTATQHERRDAAIVALLYVFALRRSEVVALDLGEQGDGLGVLRITDRTATVTLLRSKTSQSAAQSVSIDRDANPRAFAAIEAWIAAGQIEPGTPLLRGIDPAGTVSRNRLHDDRIGRAVKAAVKRHYVKSGTDPSKADELAKSFSGHSGRVGFVVSSIEGGASDTAVANVTRHKTPDMIAHYGREARQRMASPHRLPGVGV